jgi:hypothetical protein
MEIIIVKYATPRRAYMVNFDDHVQLESFEEDEVIIRVINEQTQILIDSQDKQQKAIKKLQESLQALRDYHSRVAEVFIEKPF